MSDKDTTFLIRAIREQSKGKYKVISGGKHLKVIHAEGPKKGRSVVDKDGPLIISGSPSEVRNRLEAANRLTKAGVLKFDPWNPPSRNGDEPEFDGREARREAARTVSRRQNIESDNLRAIIEPFLVKIGGSWEKRGFTTEFAHTIFYWMEERGTKFGYDSKDGFTQQVRNLSKGNSISANAIMAIQEFWNEVNSQINPRSYYMHLVGLARGAKPTRRLPVPAITKTVDGKVTELVIPEPPEPVLDPTKPSVWDFVSLAALHERSGLKWSMGLTIDDYAELQQAVGYLKAVITQHGANGEWALTVLSNFLVKMAEARFYSMANRDEER